MNNCLFCQIIKKEIPTEIIFENDLLIIFKDIHPKAPIHFLIVPKKHLSSVNELNEEDRQIISEVFLQAKKIAKANKMSEKGYRLIVNTGPDSGQIVFHIHWHMLGGKKLGVLG